MHFICFKIKIFVKNFTNRNKCDAGVALRRRG